MDLEDPTVSVAGVILLPTRHSADVAADTVCHAMRTWQQLPSVCGGGVAHDPVRHNMVGIGGSLTCCHATNNIHLPAQHSTAEPEPAHKAAHKSQSMTMQGASNGVGA